MAADFNSLFELMEAIPDEQAAIDHFTAIRWKNCEFCPYCGATKVYHFTDKRTHKCGECRQRFSIKVGTIFEDTKIPLRKWFMAIWLITSHKKGIASTQLAKDIKVTQKTAWFMLHRLRHAIRTQSFNRPLGGTVEMDETYIGGKVKNMHAHKRPKGAQGGAGKAVVFGILERGGELRAAPVADSHRATLEPIIIANVQPGTTINTDEANAYKMLSAVGPYRHYMVNHHAKEYARGEYHVNSIEGFWALLKRQIIGIHHWVSGQHLFRYVGEAAWRYNLRGIAEGSRFDALLSQATGRLTYKALIS